MGISKVVTVTCDYHKCTNGGGRPTVLSWNETEVNAGRAQAPAEALYMVILSINGETKSFCCQLCASNYFLPPAYDIIRHKVETLPVKVVDEGPVGQADGAGPENGQCDCGHSWIDHKELGCMVETAPYDFCPCRNSSPEDRE